MKAKCLASFAPILIAAITILCMVALTPKSVSAAADTCTYVGGATGSMATASDWSGCDNGTIPETVDTIVIPSGNTDITITNNIVDGFQNFTINPGTGGELRNVTLNNTSVNDFEHKGNITIGANNYLVFSGQDVVLDGGVHTFTIAGDSALRFETPLNLINTATLNISGTVSLTASSTVYDLAYMRVTDISSTLNSIINISNTNFIASISSTSISGLLSLTNSFISLDPTKLGNTTNGITAVDSTISFGGTLVEFNEPISIGGNLFGKTGTAAVEYPAIIIQGNTGSGTLEFQGALTLTKDSAFSMWNRGAKLTGPLSGSFSLSIVGNGRGFLEIASSNNTSSSPNGVVVPAATSRTISNIDASSLEVFTNETVTLSGNRVNTTVYPRGILKGTGTVGLLNVLTQARLAPGNSPGCLNSGNTFFVSGSYFDAELAGTTVCTEYDQLKVTGTLDLGNATLNTSLLNSYRPAMNNTFMIISNDGTDPVTGTFNNLAEGATFTVDGVVFKISYTGGDGNDVVLTVVGGNNVAGAPTTPNTGMKLLFANPVVTLIATMLSAGSLMVLGMKYRSFVR